MQIGTAMLLVAAIALWLTVRLELPALMAGGAFVLAGAGMGLGFTRTGVAMLAASSDRDRGFNSSALTIADSIGAALALSLLRHRVRRAPTGPEATRSSRCSASRSVCAVGAVVTALARPRATGHVPRDAVAHERRDGERRQHGPDHDQHATTGRRDRGTGHGRRRAVDDVRHPRSAGDDHDEDALQPAAHRVGRPRSAAWRCGTPTTPCRPRRRSRAAAPRPPASPPARAAPACAATPKPVIARPHTRMQRSRARPCRSTRETQPDSTPPTTAPAGIAAKSRANARPPSDGPPKSTSAISGNSARGMPKTMAIMSTTNDISSTGWPRR